MAKPSKKIQRKLEARLRGYEEARQIYEARQAGSSKALTVPGSRNPKK